MNNRKKQLRSLLAAMTREDAISFYQAFSDVRVEKIYHQRNPPTNDLKDVLMRNIDGQFTSQLLQNITNFSLSLVDQGTFLIYTTRCLLADIFQELNDPELAYTVTCYLDFPNTRIRNPNLQYTRTHSLMLQDPYCDQCWHDLRYKSEPTHPSDLFQNLFLNKS